MADSKISDLTEQTSLTGDEEFAVAVSASSKKVATTGIGDHIVQSSSGLVTDRYYTHMFRTGSGTSTVFPSRQYTVPIAVNKKTTVTRIGIDVTTAQASSTMRLGIYEFKDGVPGALVLDAGTVDTSTTGAKEITISQDLFGLYFLSMGPSTSSLATRNTSITQANFAARYLGLATTNESVNNTQIYYNSYTGGAFADPFPTPLVYLSGSTPLIWVRVV